MLSITKVIALVALLCLSQYASAQVFWPYGNGFYGGYGYDYPAAAPLAAAVAPLAVGAGLAAATLPWYNPGRYWGGGGGGWGWGRRGYGGGHGYGDGRGYRH